MGPSPHRELLDRERELEALDALIRVASQGAGRLVTVEGPAGIGKTRLLAEARVASEQAGMRVLSARGSELEQEFAHGVVRQLFEPVLAELDTTERAELFAGAAAPAAALFEQVDVAATTSGDTSFARLHGLFWLTASLAQRPLLLVIDDLHWADAPSLRFLAYLMPRLDGLPVLVVAGLRTAEPTVDQHLLAQITVDPLASALRPAPLSAHASARLVRSVLADDAEDEFCLACHTATGGNPLLLRELADAARAEGLDTTAAGVGRLYEIGPQAVRRRVALRLARLGKPAVDLSGAVAILGGETSPTHAAALAGLEPVDALHIARRLVDVQILLHKPPSVHGAAETLSFVHPLVRAAVYEGLDESARLDGHARAARLLAAAGASCERVAAHLLHTAPTHDEFVVSTLRRAADQAFARGAPDSAMSYLERCLHEQLSDSERADVLYELGTVTQLLDAAKSADYLSTALAFTEDPSRRAAIAETLGLTLFNSGRGGEADRVMAHAIQNLSSEDSDLRQRLHALLVHTALVDPDRRGFAADIVRTLRREPVGTGTGGRMLDVTIAFHDLLVANPAAQAVELARRGLGDGLLIEQANPLSVYGCFVLIAADLDEAMGLLDTWIAVAHRRGSVFALAPATCFRGLAWLSRGALADAEANLRDSWWAVTTTSQEVGAPVVASYLAQTLMEQGRLDQAAAVLARANRAELLPRAGYWAWLQASQARLQVVEGRIEDGLRTWRACGRRFSSHGGQNPAVIPWRSGAALALHHLGRSDEARSLADQEVALARRWTAPGALGRALRVSGLVRGGQDGLDLLREATDMLADSPARLEYAKALVDLGAALRRLGRRHEARGYLRRGIELAHICGAVPLVELGRTELRASGARPRTVAPCGPESLTPSERRVAELAAAGHSNRDIAQALYITANTVEAHLTRVYRKLGVTGRAQLTEIPANTV